MGFGRFVQSMFDSRICGQEVVSTQQKVYEKYLHQQPGHEPHYYLAQVYLSRAVMHGRSAHDPAMQMRSLSDTMQFACIPYPGSVRAMGLYILYKERPDVIQQYPEFSEEYTALIAPVQQAMLTGQLLTMYARLNPRMAAGSDNSW